MQKSTTTTVRHRVEKHEERFSPTGLKMTLKWLNLKTSHLSIRNNSFIPETQSGTLCNYEGKSCNAFQGIRQQKPISVQIKKIYV